jgi:DNA-binding FadR family transcriptional regulator
MAAARTADDWVRADLRFHLSLLAACRNELLIPLGTLIERTLEAHLRANAARAVTFNASLAEHTAVVDAVRARDPERARHLMQTLLAQSRARIVGQG